MTLNLKQKIINFADGLLKHLAKKMCPTGPASCPVDIYKPGLTNALIREKIILLIYRLGNTPPL